LATVLEIPVADQQAFQKGNEAQEIWEWLERRRNLENLPDALNYIGRSDLAQFLLPEAAAAPKQSTGWQGCPYPGLLSFKPSEAPIFFGRSREANELSDRLMQPDNGFIAVVGASGSGKSSLVRAGVIPKLKNDEWVWLRFTPGELSDDPFLAVANAFKLLMPENDVSIRAIQQRIRETADMAALATDVLANRPNAHLLVFIDQFEELFTLVAEPHRLPFSILLKRMAAIAKIRTVITLRADFYLRCLSYAPLTDLLRRNQASFPLDQPATPALWEMISGPAAAAGLRFEDGLPARILTDTADDPGALALMAFALHELYNASQSGTLMTAKAYESFGGVQGAIAKRADQTFDELDATAQQSFERVFKELVEVDPERGIPTRKRAPLSRFDQSDGTHQLIDRFAKARLLVCDGRDDPQVEVAHDALLSHWPKLKMWIEDRFDDLRLLRQVRAEAAEWQRLGRPKSHLWPQERLQRVHYMLDRLRPHLETSESTFIRPESERLWEEIANQSTTHERRAWIGDRLAEIGDDRTGIGLDEKGLPLFLWVAISGGQVSLEDKDGTFPVESFHISAYPVTWLQYRCFLEANDGYVNPDWWEGLAHRDDKPGRQFRRKDNYPAENVSWYDAMAYCRWFTARMGYEIRLPTEWEWQQAATGGNADREYPWGDDWTPERCNTWESGLNRSTAVGLYPEGATTWSSACVLDMAGNVMEWCSNKYDYPQDTTAGGADSRVARGGSWGDERDGARASFRDGYDPTNRGALLGLRVVSCSPIS
jgi:energy-coupling factor transporter ATP-binding protein EcfA2